MQTHDNNFKRAMSEAGLRVTSVRRQIFSVLHDADRPLEMKEIIEGLNDGHFVSVYRSIDAMSKAGVIKQIPRGFKNLYELGENLKPHHHHANCEKCGRVFEINDKKIENLVGHLAGELGFTPTKHHFEVYGICRFCGNAKM